jgi:hypothetical protein
MFVWVAAGGALRRCGVLCFVKLLCSVKNLALFTWYLAKLPAQRRIIQPSTAVTTLGSTS